MHHLQALRDEERRQQVKIYTGSGTPIWIASRHNDDGVMLMQGSSRIMLSRDEVPRVLAAIAEVTANQ
jgi:hypothetical protein